MVVAKRKKMWKRRYWLQTQSQNNIHSSVVGAKGQNNRKTCF